MASSMKDNETKNTEKNNERQQKNSENGREQNGDKEGVRADKGKGYFPLSDMQFDIVSVLNEKSKALQAYDKYILDAQPCSQLTELFERIKKDDREHVEQLTSYLTECLNKRASEK